MPAELWLPVVLVVAAVVATALVVLSAYQRHLRSEAAIARKLRDVEELRAALRAQAMRMQHTSSGGVRIEPLAGRSWPSVCEQFLQDAAEKHGDDLYDPGVHDVNDEF